MVGGRLIVVCVGCTLTLALRAGAQPTFSTSHGIQFSTIGDPGNRAVLPNEGPEFFDPEIWVQPKLVGSVADEYRLSRTEITVSQWFEFVKAYAPYNTGAPNDTAFTSSFIRPTGTLPGGVTKYEIIAGTEQYPANISWRYAARYCNWLTNDASTQPAAFESGAYDTSTFTQNAQGWYNDQLRRSPGAEFWVPSLDEWIKGMHWDPDKSGPGEGGYWYYPTSSDDPPVSGLPGEPGAQTAAGLSALAWQAVGLYPDVQTPWGLWDGSGGEHEWLEEPSQGPERWRYYDGTRAFSPSLTQDKLDLLFPSLPFGRNGLRLAASVPVPPLAPAFAAIGFMYLRRRT